MVGGVSDRWKVLPEIRNDVDFKNLHESKRANGEEECGCPEKNPEVG